MTLPKHQRSGRTPDHPRRPALPQPETGDHLVEDEQGAGCVAGGAQPVEESVDRRHQAHVGRHRLDDDAGHPLVELGDQVVGGHHRLGHRRRRAPRPSRAVRGWPPRSPRRPAGRRSDRGSTRRT